jgi:ADP-heptose:LPS heptosyltransferase
MQYANRMTATDPGQVEDRNILVIKLGALGDFVQALGPMAAIRRHHPADSITLLTTKPYAEFARKSGYFNTVLCDERPKWLNLPGWIALRRVLNGGNFTRVYDLQNNDRTALYLKLFSPRPEWVGAARGASHRNASPQRTAGIAYDGHIQTLALAGIDDVEIDDLSWIDSDAGRFALPRPYALIVPGSAASRPEKRWPADRFSALCRLLTESGITPVLIGAQNESDVIKKITGACPGCIDLCGQTELFDLPVLARDARAVIGNDTGPMHMAAPTGARTIVLYSAHSNPVRHAPVGKNVLCLMQKDVTPESVFEKI